ncbi:5'-methylthioadenosine/adenosylhomocysteine nucleosidase [Staphylococcus massiliensis]|uniref:5'-methylthioadenosine/adenosylhomocysteine nucleosidase n=1 Tax=Staphylococcus massiliensis TaxID=555791 RepID=UPI001EE0615A|nr:5'-methylthioadenosine/adenosylhomocysteine nucleosidase [Staphylococcus massiliensis]MCG3399042.1 5'-methylthioadenosine/adenosylhomocysteine nucleosidase [Staphylococcus massiliensis]
MIGIIGAMEEEVEILKNKIQDIEEIKIAHVIFYKGQLNNKDIVLTQSGIGKVNAAISTTLLIEKFNPEYIINTGSAGVLDASLNIGDVVVSNEVIYSDADARAFGYTFGQIPNMPASFKANDELLKQTLDVLPQMSLNGKSGLIVSGDSFIGTKEQKDGIKAQLPKAMACDMEATAIGQVCYQFDVPFIVTRAISDLADGNADVSFETFLKDASVSSSEMVEHLLKAI